MENFLPQLWELAKQAGPFSTALMMYLWWRSDAERRSIQDKLDKVVPVILTSMNDTKTALTDLARLFPKRR